ncbi:unnamed protein product, partial [Closterium sp. NIES-53]
ITGAGFLAVGVRFENTAGPENHQAVALRVTADNCAFFDCHFIGWQDTLYTHSGRQYYRNCVVNGSVDFIFGNGAAVLDNCTLQLRPQPNAVVTASGRTNSTEPTGIVIVNSRVEGDVAQAQFLGRPWRPFARVLYSNTVIGFSINSNGWMDWGGTVYDTTTFVEFNNSGPGSAGNVSQDEPEPRRGTISSLTETLGFGWISARLESGIAMVVIHEYQIPLPLSAEEYRIAQLYMIARFSEVHSSDNSDGDGVEVLRNEPFQEDGRQGQYTHKIYHLAKKVPQLVLAILPKKALQLEEKSWNCYPHCVTGESAVRDRAHCESPMPFTTACPCRLRPHAPLPHLPILSRASSSLGVRFPPSTHMPLLPSLPWQNPYFTKFKLRVESAYLNHRTPHHNALGASEDVLQWRSVEVLDVAGEAVEAYVPEEDPARFTSAKTGRGPFTPGWQERCDPCMVAYKLVTVDLPYWGFGPQLEKYIAKVFQRKLNIEANRKAICWMDEWHGMTMEDVRRMEAEAFSRINQDRQHNCLQALISIHTTQCTLKAFIVKRQVVF